VVKGVSAAVYWGSESADHQLMRTHLNVVRLAMKKPPSSNCLMR